MRHAKTWTASVAKGGDSMPSTSKLNFPHSRCFIGCRLPELVPGYLPPTTQTFPSFVFFPSYFSLLFAFFCCHRISFSIRVPPPRPSPNCFAKSLLRRKYFPKCRILKTHFAVKLSALLL